MREPNTRFLGSSSWTNKGRQLPRKKLLSTQASFKLCLNICDLSFNVHYNLNYLYFIKNKSLVYSQIFIIISNLTTIFRAVAGISAVITCQKVVLKNCCAYRMHEIFAWLLCMRAWRHLHLTFSICHKFNFFKRKKKARSSKHNFEINQIDDTFIWSHQFLLITGYSF